MSMKLPIVLGVIAAVLAAAVIGLGIWYSSLSKKADDYTVPDFSQLMEETEDGNKTIWRLGIMRSRKARNLLSAFLGLLCLSLAGIGAYLGVQISQVKRYEEHFPG